MHDASVLSVVEPLPLPRGLPAQRHSALSFELDDIDVIAAVTVTGETAAYVPTESLPPGAQVPWYGNALWHGRRREPGVWYPNIAVTTGAATDASPQRASAPLGAFGRLELEVTENDEPTGDDDEKSPGQFLATLHAGSLQASVGPQKLAYESLIHRDRDRRGAVAAWDLGGRIQIRGFGVQSKAESGYRRLVGSDRAHYQLNGVILEHELTAKEGKAIDVAVGWISGNARTTGTNASGGSAWSVAGSAAVLSRRLRLQAEYAGSQFEWDSRSHTGGGPRTDTGDAYRVGVEYRAPKAAPLDWHVGTEISEVAPWFGSLGNPVLDTDRTRLRAYGGASFGGWQLDLALDRRRDNLEGDPSRPVVVSDRLKLATLWSPAQLTAIDSIGRPSYKLAAELGRSCHLATGGVAVARRPLQRSVDLSLQSEFSHADWLWGMRARGVFAPGAIDALDSAGIRSLAFDLYGDFAGGSAWPVKPTLSWQRRRDAVTGTTADLWRAGAATSTIEIRDDLQANLDVSVEQHDRLGGMASDRAADVDAKLVWTLQRPSSNRDGLALAISGSLASGGRDAGNGDEAAYELMVLLSTDNPLGSW